MLLLFSLISFHQHAFANFVNLKAIVRGFLTIAHGLHKWLETQSQ